LTRRNLVPNITGVWWNGRGWPGKVPRSPVASPEKGIKKEIAKEKAADRKGTVKSRMAKKREWQLKKKKKINITGVFF
jgi:hypothetical protein